MLRPFLLAIVLLLSGCASLVPPALKPVHPAEPKRPNVLIIMTDDQNAETVRGIMPNVERRIYGQGVQYPRAYATIPICCPARAGIMTGMYGHNNLVHTLSDALNMDQNLTMQGYLSRAGYRAGMSGKFLNSFPTDMSPAFFDSFAFDTGHYWNSTMNVDGNVTTVPGITTEFDEARALEFINKSASDPRPWYFYLTLYAPHTPWISAPRFNDSPVPAWRDDPAVGELDLTDKPPYIRLNQAIGEMPKTAATAFWDREIAAEGDGAESYNEGSNIPFPMDRYLRTLVGVDTIVGEILDRLDALGELDDTIIVYTSDHGISLGDHGWWNKMAPYEPSIRVPFAIRYPPAGLSGGRIDDRLVSGADIMPTVLAATGTAADRREPDGRSLLNASWDRDMVYTEWYSSSTSTPDNGYSGTFRTPFPGVPPYGSLRGKDFHYVEYYNQSEPTMGPQKRIVTFREYYDLAKDPYEMENLLGNANPLDDPPQAKLDELAARAQAALTCEGTSSADADPCP